MADREEEEITKVMSDQTAVSEHTTTLKAFSRALAREAHVLTREPDLLWQQLHNRLQWEEEDIKKVIAPEFAERSSLGIKPWFHLKTPFRESQALLRILVGHADMVKSCNGSPDGQYIVSGSDDKTVRKWKTGSWTEQTLLEYSSSINATVFSPDGSRIALACDDRTVQVIDASSGQKLCTLSGHTGAVNNCSFSPDGFRLVSAGNDGTVRVWDLVSASVIHILNDHTSRVWAAAFSPDGQTIISAAGDETVRLWDSLSGKQIAVLQGHKGEVSCCEFSPSGHLIATAGLDRTICIWNAESRRIMHILQGHSGWVWTCKFSPDGERLVSSGRDKIIRVWDVMKGICLGVFQGHNEWINTCVYSPDGQWLVSAGDDKNLNVWNADPCASRGIKKEHADSIMACEFSPDGRLMASASLDKTLQVWDVASDAQISIMRGHSKGVDAFGFSPDGQRIVSTSTDDTLKIWEAATGKLLRTWTAPGDDRSRVLLGHSDGGLTCRYSPDGRRIVSFIRFGVTMKVWNAFTGQLLQVLTGAGRVRGFGFSPDGQNIVSAHEDTKLRVWDVSTGGIVHVLKDNKKDFYNCSYSPDGLWIVSAGEEGNVLVWEAGTGVLVKKLEGYLGNVYSCIFSPDGRWLLSISQDRIIRLLDVKTWKIFGQILLPDTPFSLGIHPWLPQLLCGDIGGALYRINIVGLEFNPVIVTAVEENQGLAARCPACQAHHPITLTQLSTELTCSTEGCNLRLKINPFVVGQHVEVPPPPAIKPETGSTPLPTITSWKLPAEVSEKKKGVRLFGPLALANGGSLVIGYDDGNIGLWLPDIKAPILLPGSLSYPVSALAITPDGSYAISGSRDGTQQVWDLYTCASIKKNKFQVEVSALAVGAKGETAVGLGDGSLRFWDSEGRSTDLAGHAERITAIAILRNGEVMSGSRDLKIRRWDPKKDKYLNSFSGHPTPITAIGASIVGNQVAWGCEDGRMFHWDPGGSDSPLSLQGDLSPVLAAVAGKRHLFLSGGKDGVVVIFNYTARKMIFRGEYGVSIISGALSPDGSHAAACDEQGNVYRFKVEQ